QLVAQKSNDVAAIIQLGLAEKARGRPEAATEWFLRARELEPDSSVVQFYLGEIYYNRGLNADALAALERAVQLNPDNANAHYLMPFVLGDLAPTRTPPPPPNPPSNLNPPLPRSQPTPPLDPTTQARKTQNTP